MTQGYGFQSQLAIGKDAERCLDTYFARWYVIEAVPREVERDIKADRIFITPEGKQRLVEYKTDYMCHKTGNLVVETVSVDRDNAPGWAITSQADVLVWWLIGLSEVLAIPMWAIKGAVPEWNRKYRKVKIPNETYNTIGILVPVWEIKESCLWQGELKQQD